MSLTTLFFCMVINQQLWLRVLFTKLTCCNALPVWSPNLWRVRNTMYQKNGIFVAKAFHLLVIIRLPLLNRERVKRSVYWSGQQLEIRRCSWFHRLSGIIYARYRYLFTCSFIIFYSIDYNRQSNWFFVLGVVWIEMFSPQGIVTIWAEDFFLTLVGDFLNQL